MPARTPGDGRSPAAFIGEAWGMFGAVTGSPDDYEVRFTADAPLTTPTPDGSGETTHPCVVFVPGGWRGYRYWMAVTPYPAADAEEENPCILCSVDGDTWVVPTGLTNPVDPWPGGSDYNSDTDMCLDPNGEVMHMWWRAVEPSASPARETIYVASSRDGVVWSTPVAAIQNNQSSQRIVSPTFWWDPAGKVWVMVGVDIVPSPNTLVRYTAPAPAGPWTQDTDPTVTGGSLPSGREMWHIQAKAVGDVVLAVLNDTALNASGSGGALFLMRSDDQGQSWTLASSGIINRWGGTWDASLYRSCIVPLPNGDLDLWYAGISAGNAWRTGRCRVTQKWMRNAYENEVVAAAHGAAPWILGDRFRRGDGTSGLGTLDSGESWTAASGTWGIASNRAYLTAATNGRVTVAGLADLYMECQFTTLGGSGQSMWLNFRYTDSSNFWRWGTDFGTAKLQKVVAGSTTDMLTTTNVAAGDRFCVWASGNDIWVGINGQRRAKITDSHAAASTTVGLQTNSTVPRFRNFMVRALVNGV